MAATAAAMGAAAAAIRKKEEDVEKQRMRSKNAAASGEFEKPLTAKEQQEERLQMKDFEEEFMKMLTKTSLRRFAQADGVPAADTQEKILEKCTRRAAKKKNQQQEGENTATNDDDDEDSDVDEDDEKIDIGVLGLLSPSQILSQLAKEVQDRRGDGDGEEEEEAELAEDDEYVYSAEDFDDEYGEKMRARRQKEREENPGAHPEPPTRKPFELDFDSKFLTPQERQQLRREHDLRWANAVPSRLRQWLDSESRTKNDNVFLSLDIFCELVVRIPIEGVGKEEVLAFCSPFGQCEYQGPCFSLSELKKAAEARKNKNNKKKDDVQEKQEEEPPQQQEEETEKAKQARIRNETRKFCHIIRFNKGVDAIRCFIELNGFYIDPHQYVSELNSAAARLLLASKKKQFFNNLRETGFLTSALGDDLTIKSGETFNEGDEDEQDLKRCWTSRYIFVTCDFFRISFFDKAGLSAGTSDFIPRSEMTTRSPYEDSSSNNSNNKNNNGAGGISGFFSSLFGAGNGGGGIKHKNLQPPPSSVSSKIPSNWNPADIVCKKLATRAKELIGVFPLAASHKDIEWVGICRAANTISMFIPLVSSNDKNPSSSSSPRVWVLTLRALRACQVNIVALFRAIDASETVDELMDLGWKFAASQEIGENNSKNLGAGNSSLSRQKDEEDRIKNNSNNNKKKNEQQGFWSQFAFGNFFVGAGDPGQRKTNRMIERGAIFLFALVVVWVSFVAYGMMSTENSESKLNHVKGKKPFASSEQNSHITGKNSKKKDDKNRKKKNNANQHPNFNGEDFTKMFQEKVRGGDL